MEITNILNKAYEESIESLDYAAKKQSLKNLETQLGITHEEVSLPWDQPVTKEQWDMIPEYCEADAIAVRGDFLMNQHI